MSLHKFFGGKWSAFVRRNPPYELLLINEQPPMVVGKRTSAWQQGVKYVYTERVPYLAVLWM